MKKVAIVIASIFIIFILLILNGWKIEFEPNNIIDETYEVGDQIEIPEVTAKLKGKHLFKNGFSIHVETIEDIDAYTIGKYNVRYKASFLWDYKNMSYKVYIKDTTAPVLTLNDSGRLTPLGEEYIEEGYTAIDNNDGDITDQVHTLKRGDVITYSVKDSSGNATTVERQIKYADTTAPIITLKGDATITIKEGEQYVEPGFEAIDDVDKNITDKVNIEKEFNTNTPGEYKIIYFVKDSSDNYSEVIRTLIVEKDEKDDKDDKDDKPSTNDNNVITIPEKNNISNVSESKEETSKIIYLTFDDGPSKYTKDLLDILKRYDVKATFFVVDTPYSDYISDIFNDGHSIGAHSSSHEYKKIYTSEKAYFEDLDTINQLIEEETGSRTNLIRFPGGSSNTVSEKYNIGIMSALAQDVEKDGYIYVDWNVSSGDAGETTSTEEVYKNVISGVKDHNISVVLQHDTKKFSIDAVEDIIIWGQQNGYTFLPLTDASPVCHHHINN